MYLSLFLPSLACDNGKRMASSLRILFCAALAGAVFFVFVGIAHATITVDAPPIDVLFENENATGGSYIPLMQFKLKQTSGTDTLTSVKVGLHGTTTPGLLFNTDIHKLFLFKEGGQHTGFQANEDTAINTGVNAVVDPAPNATTTITVNTAQNSVGSGAAEYYVVALATSTQFLNTGRAFYALTPNAWITTSGGDIGTAFKAERKITFQQTAPITISEVRLGSSINAGDEFIELYNTSEFDIEAAAIPLNLFIFDTNGGAELKTLRYFKTIIPGEGFYLIASETNFSQANTVPPDAVYTTLSGNTLISHGGLSIATSSVVANATSTAVDRIAWGDQPAANAETAALGNLGTGGSYERKANANSTIATLSVGGSDASKGNSLDNNNNSTDFVAQPAQTPQNSSSPPEFPFGGGGNDLESVRVLNSWPRNNDTGIPVDFSFIGFEFNKTVATTTIISAVATTTVTLTAAGSDTNLCASVSYNPLSTTFDSQAKCTLSANLSPNTLYTFTASTTIKDLSGRALDQDHFTAGNQGYVITFTTGGVAQRATNVTPPSVLGTTPSSGTINAPTNLSSILVQFNTSQMDVSTLTSVNITLTSSAGSVTLSQFSFNATSSVVSFVPGSLAANTKYTLTVGTGVKNTNQIALASPYVATFTTGSGGDATAPALIGIFPNPGTTLALNTTDFVFLFDDDINPTTATSTAVTLSTGGANLPGTVSYDPVAKEGRFTAANSLPAGVSDLTLTFVAGALKNLSGVGVAQTKRVWATESQNSDVTPPSVQFVNVDQFNIAVTFDEAVRESDAKTLANYAVTVGGNSIALSALAGHSITYDAATRTAKISGILVASGQSFSVSVSNMYDISGNKMTSAAIGGGTTLSSADSKGFLGPGQGTGDFGPQLVDFSSAGIGFMPGTNVMVMNQFISASTTYGIEIPLTKQIPANGTIVITFPATSDYEVCCAATSSGANPFINEQNKDINGPGAGTIGIKTIAKSASAKSVTLTLGTATRSESGSVHDFLRFALNDIRNPSVPKDANSAGYVITIKTRDASANLLESFTSNPIYISGGGVGGSATTTIHGIVTGQRGNLQGVTIRMMSRQVGMVEQTTDTNGQYSFGNIPVNNQIGSFGSESEYMLFTDPFINPTGTTTAYFGEPIPTPVRATSTSTVKRDFTLTATSSAINFDIKLTGNNASNGIFKAGEQLDVFAGGPSQFITRTITTSATNYSATVVTTIPIPQVNGSWGIGIGPAMPKSMGNMTFGPPPAPAWVMPKPIEVFVSGCPSTCVSQVGGEAKTSHIFTVSAADKTIIGILKDDSGNVLANAGVFAFSPTLGIGNHGQTTSAGIFSIQVGTGSYNVGAFIPGMGSSGETPVLVNSSGSVFVNGASAASTGSSGANPFVLKMKKPSYAITGQITDGSSAVSNSAVFAYRTDASGHADGMSDSSGNYTLYVDNGTWKVNTFIPGYGPMAEQSVTISGASQSGINFSPSTAKTFYKISGIVFESADAIIATSTEGVSGVVVRVSGANGSNEGRTGTDGIFSIRVPAGSYSIVDIFKPGYGRIPSLNHNLAAITTIDASAADAYQAIRINTRRTITINIKDSGGNPLKIDKAFIDLFDAASNFGNHAEITNGTTTTIQIADGASTTIRAFIQGVPPANVSVASDDSTNTLVLSGVLEVNGNETVKVTVNTSTAAFSRVSGTIYVTSAASGNELTDAWVQFVDPTNNVHFGTEATTSGVFFLKLVDGTYQVQAFKPGYVSTPASVTVSGTTTVNVIVTTAASTITGTITAGGPAASGAYVWAEKLGGGFASAQTDTSGAYTLRVSDGQWKVYAAADGYAKAAYTSNPVQAGATGISIPLSTKASISSTIATSNTFTDTSTGSFSDSTLGVQVNLDSGALGSSGNNSYVTAKETSNIPHSLDVNIINDTAMDINAINGSNGVTNLQTGKTAEITLTYTKAELVAEGIDTTTKVGNLKVIAWSDNQNAWESLTTVATYKDSSGNPITSPSSNLSGVSTVDFITAEASHFSPYALSAASDSSAPATPSGLSASQASNSNSINLAWTANGESDLSGYFIYRDTDANGSFPLLTSVGAVTSYTDSTGSFAPGQTYLYRLAAFDTDNNESAAGGSVSLTIALRGGGGGIVGGGGGGGGSRTAAPTSVSALVPAPSAPGTIAQALPSGVSATAQRIKAVSLTLTRGLDLGSRGDDVTKLQEYLASDPALYPEGTVSGYFGSLTRRAVQRFQEKYDIAKEGDLGYGFVGPKTREKLHEASSAPFIAPAAQAAVPPLPAQAAPRAAEVITLTRGLDLGSRGDDVTKLQEYLASDPALYPEGTVSGYFGSLTRRAVQRFQEKYDIAKEGDLGYGFVGPKTRAKIEEVANVVQSRPSEAVPPSSGSEIPADATSDQAKQIKLLQQQIQLLREAILKFQP